MKRHVVAEVYFARDLVACTCGAEMPIETFPDHRKSAGQERGGSRALGPAQAPAPHIVWPKRRER